MFVCNAPYFSILHAEMETSLCQWSHLLITFRGDRIRSGIYGKKRRNGRGGWDGKAAGGGGGGGG